MCRRIFQRTAVAVSEIPFKNIGIFRCIDDSYGTGYIAVFRTDAELSRRRYSSAVVINGVYPLQVAGRQYQGKQKNAKCPDCGFHEKGQVGERRYALAGACGSTGDPI